MGDPKRFRKKYATPNHPWNLAVIEVGRKLKREYGLAKNKEILIASSFLKRYKDIAKRLIAAKSAQSEKEKQQILGKLTRLGLLPAGADINHVFSLEIKDILERRLQSVVARKGLARSMKQARQFITHRHVKINEREITAPSFLVTLEDEAQITFKENSALCDEKHPERVDPNQKEREEAQKIREQIKDNKETDNKETSTEEKVDVVKPTKDDVVKSTKGDEDAATKK